MTSDHQVRPAMAIWPAPLRAVARAEWLGLLLAMLVGAAVLAVIAPAFLTEFNIYVVLRNFSITALVALAQMIALSVGQMNLSVGALGGLVAVLAGGMMEVWGVPIPLAVAVGLLIGTAGGLINGILVVSTGINGFIITLATLSVFSGINLGLTEAVPFYNQPAALVAFGQGRFGPIPYLLVVPLVVAALLAVFLARMPAGRRLLAVGGNPHAAALSGLSPRRAVVLAHALSGALASIAGILAVARLGSAQPTIGSDWLLLSFAAPIIGGAALTGGHVSVMGTLIAVMLIVLIDNGLVLAKVDPFWVQFLLGALILAAVGANRLRSARFAPRPAGAGG